MKKLSTVLFLLITVFIFGQINYTVAPNPFDETDQITVTIPGDQIDEVAWGVSNHAIYIWSWSLDANYANSQDCPTNGGWNDSNETNRLNYNLTTDSYSLSFTPSIFFNRTGIGRFGFLLKNKIGSHQTSDVFVDVGVLSLNLTHPLIA